MTIKPGDVVLLKSGGPSMTVVSVDEDEIGCVWTGDDGEPFRETFPPIALDPAESDREKDDDEDDEDDDEEDGKDADEDADEHEGRDNEGADAESDDDEMVEPEDGRLRRRAGRK